MAAAVQCRAVVREMAGGKPGDLPVVHANDNVGAGRELSLDLLGVEGGDECGMIDGVTADRVVAICAAVWLGEYACLTDGGDDVFERDVVLGDGGWC